MIVVDINIISYLLIPNEQFNELADELYQKDSNWIAPSLWKYELLSVLSVYLRQSILKMSALKTIFNRAFDIVEAIDLVDTSFVFNVIETSSLSAYDSQFVALASEQNIPLITEDKKILRAFPKVAVSLQQFLT